ncbi:ABC transporter permease [Paenibacillus silvisoli]|uniref:ABC transporter permease n=1 Tax=Paenibacillus silvisoli TaxID=3110539 RepID=UPI0028065530|nr:ABC transporter permease subunit [Paenibacillus silvisoli]
MKIDANKAAPLAMKVKLKLKHPLIKRMLYYKYFYILIAPAIVLYILFSYIPLYGTILAFKDFNFAKGILHSPWTGRHGFQHFYDLLSEDGFRKAFWNTIVISLGRIIFEFPIPIALAFLINEIRSSVFKKIAQTLFTFPHFISWVVVAGIFFNLLADAGVLNQIIVALGGEKINLLTQPGTFRGLLFATNAWKEAGWSTIIYLAAISGVNPQLYEAAIVDGANRFQLMRYITWPALKSVIGVLLILQIANSFSYGFDQIFNLYNAAVFDVSDTIDTYIYRRTFISGLDFGSSTAIGLFKALISLILMYMANFFVTRSTGKGLY